MNIPRGIHPVESSKDYVANIRQETAYFSWNHGIIVMCCLYLEASPL